MERNFDENPYSDDERRVAEYIVSMTDGQVGAGADPIGFLLASHSCVAHEKKALDVEHHELMDSFYYLFKWVERGQFDPMISMEEALNCIAYHPSAPWKNGRWDVDHKPYAAAFYAKFPKAKGD